MIVQQKLFTCRIKKRIPRPSAPTPASPPSHLRLVVSDAFLFLPFPLPCQPSGSFGEVGILAGTFSLTWSGNPTYNVARSGRLEWRRGRNAAVTTTKGGTYDSIL